MDSFLGWWLDNRRNIDKFFLPFHGIISTATGLVMVFGAVRIDTSPFVLHLLELLFSYTLNAAILFCLTRGLAEEGMNCLAAFPTTISMLAFTIFTLCFRLIPGYTPYRPWLATFEIAVLQKTWMNHSWMLVAMISGSVVLVVSYWVTSKARFGDLIRPMITYFEIMLSVNITVNLMLNYSCY